MNKIVFKLFYAMSLVFTFALPCVAVERGRVIDGVVTKVSDGDTIQVTDQFGTKVKVRFYGVDAPETEKGNKRTGKIIKPGQPFGEEGYQALNQKLQRQNVRLEIMDTDQYKRAVAIVWLGNRNINREMVSEGWGWAYRQYLDRPHASEYIQAEEQARRAHIGLWQQNKPTSPWEFRKTLKAEKTQHKGWF